MNSGSKLRWQDMWGAAAILVLIWVFFAFIDATRQLLWWQLVPATALAITIFLVAVQYVLQRFGPDRERVTLREIVRPTLIAAMIVSPSVLLPKAWFAVLAISAIALFGLCCWRAGSASRSG